LQEPAAIEPVADPIPENPPAKRPRKSKIPDLINQPKQAPGTA
jgi:hypothetical protein